MLDAPAVAMVDARPGGKLRGELADVAVHARAARSTAHEPVGRVVPGQAACASPATCWAQKRGHSAGGFGAPGASMFAAGCAQPLVAAPPDSRLVAHGAACSSSVAVQPRGRRACQCSANSSGQPAPRRKSPSSAVPPAQSASAWASAQSVAAPGPLFEVEEVEPLSAGAPPQTTPNKARVSPPGRQRHDGPSRLHHGSTASTLGSGRHCPAVSRLLLPPTDASARCVPPPSRARP